MRRLKKIIAVTLVSFSCLAFPGCPEKLDIDKCTFSAKFQKFYCHNDFTNKDWEYAAVAAPVDMVCIPYDQYIEFQKDYVCKRK